MSGVFNRLCMHVGCSPIRLARLLGSSPLNAPAFAPAVAHVGPGRGRFPFPWCCLASLVTFGGRQSPPPTGHRRPGSSARLASRNAVTLQVRRRIPSCTYNLFAILKNLSGFVLGGVPPPHKQDATVWQVVQVWYPRKIVNIAVSYCNR